ncbi:uncharacterized protein LOC123271516 [Cotesia glomerata]|uniref:uncharacterized protein LOC123271516 n=1 Tax=Cotesia glomerata TaxID=32391 RepID=UPI001D029B5B|nr:uncharacterized protein LOC123271516 [Cotesia glomerata]
MSNYDTGMYAQLVGWAAEYHPEAVETLLEVAEQHYRRLRIAPCHTSRARFWATLRAWWYASQKPSTIPAISLMWRCSRCKVAIASPGQCQLRAKQVLERHLRPIQQVEYAIELLSRNTPPTLVPKVSRELSRTRAMALAEKLRDDPDRPPIRHAGCWNCALSHPMADCPFPRGTFCAHCGHQGFYFEECPRCKPGLFGLPP